MHFSFSFPLWIGVPGLVIAAIIIAFTYLHTDKPLSRRLRVLLIILRSLSVGLVLICLLEPTLIAREEHLRKTNLLFLVDDSQSMSLPDEVTGNSQLSNEGITRIDAVKESLIQSESNPIKALADKFSIRLYQFSFDLKSVEALNLKADGTLTDIGKAISKAAEEWRGQPTSGIVLISDGGNNSGKSPLEIAGQLGIPIYTVGVGSAQMPRDIQISRVEASPIAYAGHILPVRAIIKSSGYDGREVKVSLVSPARILDSASLKLDSRIVEQSVDLQLKPQQEGTFSFSVTIPAEPDELTVKNNTYPFFIKVVKSKLRVLHIDGRPRWEYTFLKRALQQDPNIEPVSLVVTKGTQVKVTRNELFSYDILILGDMSPGFFSAEQLSMINGFVEDKGGSLIFLGGKSSLGRGGFGESVLRGMLPIDIGSGGARQVAGAFNPVLTQEGLRHPLTRLSNDQTENISIWRDLPALTHFYMGTGIKMGATVLAEHQREQGQPVIVLQRYGNGMVLMIASDSLWRWSFGAYPFGGDDSHYHKFWSGAIRWLASVRTEANLVNVETDKGTYYRDEKVRITTYVYDESYSPIDNAELKAQIQMPGLQEGAGESPLKFASDGNGRYSSEFIPPRDGHYKINVEVIYAGGSLGKGTAEFIVQPTVLEFQDTQLKEDFLKSLADTSGGSYHHLRDISNLPASIKEANLQPYTFIHERGLWDNAVVLIMAVVLLSAEWLLRKQRGLV